MLLKKETSYRVVELASYSGVCDSCGAPVEYLEPMVAIELDRNENVAHLWPIDMFSCPSCYKTLRIINYYFNMEITGELAKIEKGA